MKDKKYSIIAVLDTIEDKLIQQSLELICFADSFALGDPDGILLVIPGKSSRILCESISLKYGIDAAPLEHDDLYLPNPELLAEMLHEIIDEYKPESIILTHTIRNCQTAAKLSVSLKALSITAVESFAKSDEWCIFQRSIFNGKIRMRVSPQTPLKILTVLSGAFTSSADRPSNKKNGSVVDFKFTGMALKPDENKNTVSAGYNPLSLSPETETDVKLEEADVIVSAGRGIGKEENLSLIREAASIFENAAVGASRPVCDQRWLPLNHQVGITGKSVAPKLYLACGISGSQQHIAGMKNSQCIVAVNKDPNAAIFSVADYIIVEDLLLFLPLLVKKYKEKYEE
jgi:electron transfer flavoprotein alpha subunit